MQMWFTSYGLEVWLGRFLIQGLCRLKNKWRITMDKMCLKDLLIRKQREIEMSKFDNLMDAYLDAIIACTTKGRPYSLHHEARQALREHFWKATTMCIAVDKYVEDLN